MTRHFTQFQKVFAGAAALLALLAAGTSILSYMDQSEKDRVAVELKERDLTRTALSALGFEGADGGMEIYITRSGDDEFYSFPEVDEDKAREAIQDLEILSSSDDESVLSLWFVFHVVTGDILEAQKYFSKMEKYAGELSEADTALAFGTFLYARFGLKSEAEQIFDQMLTLESANSRHVYEFVKFLHSSGHRNLFGEEQQKAIELLRRAIDREPGTAELHHALAHILSETSQNSEAILILKTLIDALPDYADAYNTLGCIQWQRKNYLSAKASFESALSVYPTHSQYLYNLAVTLQELDKSDMAEEKIQQAIRLSNDRFSIENQNGRPVSSL